MGGAEGVVLALAAPRKARDAFVLAQLVHLATPAGQDLVRIRLVADVPDEPVVGSVEDGVQRDGQLDRAEVRRQVPTRTRNRLQHELAQLGRQVLEGRAIEPAQVGRAVDGLEQCS